MADPIVVTQSWRGSTAAASYPHRSEAEAAGKPALTTGVSPDHGGTGEDWDPEDLYGAALSTCFLYTFLALAKKARLDVVAYDDTVTLHLVTEERRTRIDRVVLAPVVTLAAGSNLDKAATMFHKAHKYCVIANSTAATLELDPSFKQA